MTTELAQFAIPLPVDGALANGSRSLVARIMPWGVSIVHEGQEIVFDRDSITYDASRVVPLVVDHGSGVHQRIGRLERIASRPDGLYGTFTISETQLGLEVHQLLLDKVIDEVSAGVALTPSREYVDAGGIRHRFGILDHVAVVGRGAFGKAGARVLAVHAETEGNMNPNESPEPSSTPTGGAPEPAKLVTASPADVAIYEERVGNLERLVAQLSVPGAVDEKPKRGEFANIREFVLTLGDAQRGNQRARERIEAYALADDTTTTAVGVVPDYQSNEVITIIDEERPFVESLPSDPIGDHGMSVVYPQVVTKPTVDVQSAEKTEVESTAMDIDPKSVDLVTYAGASDVARQLIERSQPSFVDILFREYASAYAQKTDAAAIASALSAVTATAVLADLGASAAATQAAFNVAQAAIIAAVRRPATHWCLGATRWGEINDLVDSTGRPLLVFPEDGPSNAAGTLGQMSGKYRGVTVYLDPNAPATTALLYNADRFAATLESDPVQLQAEVVSLLGFEMGVYGLFATVVKHIGGGYKLTAS
jgi:HK97 family phage major capsid protein